MWPPYSNGSVSSARPRVLLGIPGIGPIIATALIAAVGDARAFRRGRDLAAWLGIVPKQYSTGGKTRLLGISKQGNSYLRWLLIHGARTLVRHAARRTDALGCWIRRLQQRKATNVVTVALANKLARAACVVLHRQEPFRAAALVN